MDGTDNKGWWAQTREHPYFWFAAPIITALGIPGTVATFTGEDLEVAFSLGVIAPLAIILSILLIRNRTSVRLPSAHEAKRFFPFRRADNGRGHALFDQESRQSRFESTLAKGALVTILIGESGVGKSTLLYSIRDSKGIEVVKAEKSFTSLCETIKDRVSTKDDRVIRYIAIDQSERIRGSLERDRAALVNILGQLLSLLKSKNIGLIFAVRSDLAVPILRLVDEHGPILHFVSGIEFPKDQSSLQFAMAHFDTMTLSKREMADIRHLLLNGSNINSFALQTGGYLIESLTKLERAKYFNPFRFDDDAIAQYIELVFSEYSDKWNYSDRSIHIEIVLFTVSIYNRRHIDPISAEEICQVTSMPMEYVDDALNFLDERGVIEATDSVIKSYYVTHDLIASEILDKQPKYMKQDHRLAISELINDPDAMARIPIRSVEVNPFHRIVTSRVDGPFVFSLSLVSIWLGIASYGYRLQSNDFGNWIKSIIPDWVLHIGGNVPVHLATYMFPAIFFTLYCWIIFMYGLDRGYFYYLYKQKAISGVSYSLVHIAGPIGILIGLTASVAPSIFLFGVIIPGSLIAIAHMEAALRSQRRKSVFARSSFRFTWQTVVNMIIGTSTWYLMQNILRYNTSIGNDIENVILISWVAAIFGVFAFAMRERQGSETGRWVLLSVFAASRM